MKAAFPTLPVSKSQNENAVSLDLFACIPEEQVWLDRLKTANTRRTYQQDVGQFIKVMGIQSSSELYAIDYRAVIYWEKNMREVQRLEPSSIRRRLSALSSLFSHLCQHGLVEHNPVREIKRPEVDRTEGKTLAFSKKEARKLLDAPDAATLMGKRDRAILSIEMQVGFRREEIVHLAIDALHRNRGLDALWVRRKRKRNRQSVTINPQTAQRIRDYLEMAGHTHETSTPLFRPVRNNGQPNKQNLNRFMHPDAPDRILRKYARLALGIQTGFSAHSMRTTFATTALEQGAELEEVQYALGHADVSTTKLYERRSHLLSILLMLGRFDKFEITPMT